MSLVLVAAVFVSSPAARASTWSAVTVTGLGASKQIVDIDVSGDGQVVAVVGQYDYVYVSTNGGATWSKPASVNPSTRDWIGVDVSHDGTKIVAAYNGYLSPNADDGGVWMSTNSGSTWSDVSPDDGLSSFFRLSDVAVSDDGVKVIACGDVYNSSNTGYVWVSTNSGATWSTGGSARKYFRGCTMDSDGSVMYAAGNGQMGSSGGGVFKSTDDGATWTTHLPSGTATDNSMWFVATNSTGTVVLASVYGSSTKLYSSTNSGVAWTASSASFSSVRRTFVSRDGSTFVANVTGGIAVSTDGVSYTSSTIFGSNVFSSFAGSADMSKVWATHYSSGVFSNTSFSTDITPPTATWTAPSSPSSSRTLSYTLTFSESVSGIAAGDFSNTGTATGCVFSPSGSSGSSVTVSVTCSSDGTVVARLASNSVSDAGSNQGPSSATSALSVTIDSGAPTATWTAPSSPSSSRTLSYLLTFNESVSGITAGDFSSTGTATGCVFTPSSSSGSSVTVSVTCSSDGTVVARLNANSILDAASNTGPGTATSAASVTIDTVGSTTTTSTSTSSTSSTTSTSTTVAGPTTTVASQSSTTTTPVTNPGSSSGSSTTVATSGGSGSQTPSTSTTTTTTTTTTIAPKTTLSEIDVPDTEVGGASALVDGTEVPATITRENNELRVTVGTLNARIWAVSQSGGKVPLDLDGRLRLMPGDSVTVDLQGFDAGSPVEVRLYSDPLLLGKSQVDGSGILSAAYEIPQEAENGNHNVVMIGTGNGKDVTLGLSIAIGKESGGINTWVIILPIGLAILAALLLPVVLRRRRVEDTEIA